jgi:hypothetical protein
VEIPLALKLVVTLFVAVLVPVYWVHWGPANFLWFSDVALFGALVALWLESSLVASMMALAVLLPEAVWNIDYFGRLLTGRHPFGLTRYMWDRTRPLPVRALSLFHVWLPPLLVWMVARLGHDRRAWLYQSALAAVLLPLSRLLTDPAENVNWVHGLGDWRPRRISPAVYLTLLVAGFALILYLPPHLALLHLFGR